MNFTKSRQTCISRAGAKHHGIIIEEKRLRTLKRARADPETKRDKFGF